MSGGLGSSLGRLALTAVGYYFGGPLGGVIGGMAGQLLFPGKLPSVEGPRLNDTQFTSSAVGSAVPICFGTIPVAGNIIWSAEAVEHKNTKKVGGKGAPEQKVSTYTYTRSFALALCEGPINGVLRIWANSTLKFDLSPQRADEDVETYFDRIDASTKYAAGMTIYLGDEEQLPDPTMEADKGVGNVPAHRGMAYIVFADYDVTDFGGRPPTFMVEISTEPGEQSEDFIIDPAWESYPSSLTGDIPVEISDGRIVMIKRSASEGWFSEGTVPAIPVIQLTGNVYSLAGESLGTEPYSYRFDSPQPNPHPSLGLVDSLTVSILVVVENCPPGFSIAAGEMQYDWQLGTTPTVKRGWISGGQFVASGAFSWVVNQSAFPWARYFKPVTELQGAIYLNGEGGGSYQNPGTVIRRYEVSPLGIAGAAVTAQVDLDQDGYDNCFSCTDDGTYVYFLLHKTGNVRIVKCDWETLEQLEHWDYASGVLVSGAHYGLLIGGACNRAVIGNATRPEFHVIELNEDGTTTVVEVNSDVPYNGYVSYVWSYANRLKFRSRWVTAGCDPGGPITLGEIVSRISARTGMGELDFDVAELTETVPGYKIESVMTARSAIEPLQSYGFFDAVESGGQILYPLRGKAEVGSLDEDDLGAHDGGQDMGPPLVALERAEDVELPRLVRVHYYALTRDYAAGEQKDGRLIGGSVNVEDYDLPIAMSDDKAKQIAQIILGSTWVGRESYKFAASPRWLGLDPADPLFIPVEGETTRARIISIQFGSPGLLEIEALRDDASVYTSVATGVSHQTPQPALSSASPTVMTVIDGPALDASANDAGFYIAARGIDNDNWKGCTVYQSVDGGANYEALENVLDGATTGRVFAVLPDRQCATWDRVAVIEVSLDDADMELESRTEEAVLNGANAAFIGVDGRWEVIQFATATQLDRKTWQLSTLLRGRRGTEWAAALHEEADQFVFIGAGVVRIPLDNGQIGLERLYKAVSFGLTLGATASQAFTAQGVALECYAPVHAAAEWDDDGNITIGWIRRTRLSGEWLDSADVPLNEQYLQYSVDIENSAGTVLRTLSATANRVTYTTDQQLEDFGSLRTSVRASIYQVSAVVGRGYVGTACAG